MFPLVVDLAGRRVVVIGAGVVGARKAEQLLAARARVIVISEVVRGELPDVESVVARRYEYGDLVGAFLVVAATGDSSINDLIAKEANELSILLNVVDDAARSNFFFPAVHRDGDVTISISTNGASPALAQWIRDFVGASLPRNLARVAIRLRAERASVHARGESTENLPWSARVSDLIAAVDSSPSLNRTSDGQSTSTL